MNRDLEQDDSNLSRDDIAPVVGANSGEEMEPAIIGATVDVTSAPVPHLAPVESIWSRSVRTIVIGVVIVASLVYLLFGTILARNVTFNRLIDEGAYNGIRRFRRETIMDVWRTMWDRAPDFGSIDLTRGILLVSTVAFFAAFVMIVTLVFVPSRREWATGLGDGQESDTVSGD